MTEVGRGAGGADRWLLARGALMWLVVLGGERTFRMYVYIRSRTCSMVGAGEAPPVEKVGFLI